MSDASWLPPCTVELATRVDTGDEWHQQHPAWLYAAITSGSFDVAGVGPIAVSDLGTIPVPDGRLVACDPFAFGSAVAPFTLEVPQGEHLVAAALTTMADAVMADGDVRVLAALAVFDSQPVTRWTLGRRTEETVPGPFTIGDVVGYEADSGTGCLASPQTLPALIEVLEADGGRLEDPLSTALDAAAIPCVVGAPRADAGAVAMFRIGGVARVCATWFGHAADGSAVLAMTDFGLVADPWSSVDPAR